MRVWKHRLMFCLVAGLTMAWVGIDEGEYKCESALAHVKDCCGGSFDPTLYQCIRSSGCGNITPDLSIADADCLRQKSCDAIKAEGICTQPRLGGDGLIDHQPCEDALARVADCCGQSVADRWVCAAPTTCGVRDPNVAVLSDAALMCIHANNSCTLLKAAGVCSAQFEGTCH